MTEILDESAVSEIEARYEKTTPGPFMICHGNTYFQKLGRTHTADILYERDYGGRWIGAIFQDEFTVDEQQANGAFFAHAREDIPALVATVKHLRLQVDLCEKAFELDGALTLSEVGDLNALQVVRKMAELQSQLEQLRAERDELSRTLRQAGETLTAAHAELEAKLPPIIKNGVAGVIADFRSRAIQFCKDKAAEWEKTDSDTPGEVVTHQRGRATAAYELADELEKL